MMKTRRFFLKTSVLGSGLLAVGCTDSLKNLIDASPLAILKRVQTDLFPQDAVNDSNAYRYLSVILKHSLVRKEDKQYLRNGTRWLNEEAQSEYKKEYLSLSDEQRQALLKTISNVSWGRSWIKVVLTYIMEAVLGDPVYGINKKEFGWKWIEHEPGFPRPKEAIL